MALYIGDQLVSYSLGQIISLADGAITTEKLADGAVTFQKVSAAIQASLNKADASAPLNSPTFTGNPAAPTPAAGDNDTSIATTAFVQGEFSAKTVTSDTDVTATRLLKNLTGPAQAFRRGNVLGTVSQSGGVPTGAAMELGSNANGFYARFANGMQICWRNDYTIVHAAASRLTNTWTYPAAFSGNSPSLAMSFSAASASFTDCTGTDLGACAVLAHGTTSTSAGMIKNDLSTNFIVTSEIGGIQITAIGRWF